jgi:hypothetical protein
MEREHKSMIRPILRYPLFLLGLLIIIVGGVLAIHFGAGTDVEVGITVVGFLSLLLSVALR